MPRFAVLRFNAMILGCMFVLLSAAAHASAQAREVITIVRGTSDLIQLPVPVQRVSIGDPEIADAVVVSPREILINATALGTTTLIVWDASGNRRFYTIEVTANAAALERQLQMLFPGEEINVTASGNVIVLSGRVSEAGIARRALEIARGTGATVIENLAIPAAKQVLLQVRFAEVSRTASQRLGTKFGVGEGTIGLDRDNVVGGGQEGILGEGRGVTLADGLMRLFLFEDNIQVDAVITALKANGVFRTLAEPNLLAIEGEEASFLAGGEFPYPVPQPGGGQNNAPITIQFREFGVQLRFLPRITIAGNIRLEVAPEVSTLDFANGVQLSGFSIPSLLTRRAETAVELRDGQTFAIAGLMDNALQSNATKVPFLGDIPILGAFFRSKDVQQRRTELLVLVTPRIVQPSDVPSPLPTGEPETWDWDRRLRNPVPSSPTGSGR